MYRSAPLLLLACLLLLSLAPAAAQDSEATYLFTPEEAEKLAFSDAQWKELEILSPKSMGPVVVIENPEVENQHTIKTKTPTNLQVLFKDRLAPVDMESLKVVGKKFVFSKDLTDKIKPYLKGQSISARELQIPSGKFQLEISIADVNGQETVREFKLLVE